MDAPSNIRAVQERGGSPVIRITWDPAANAGGYRIYRAESPYGPFSLVAVTADAGYLDHNLLPSRTYFYYAVSVQENGMESAPTKIVSVHTQDGLRVSVDRIAANALDISWNPVVGVECFSIYRSGRPEGPFQMIGSVRGTHFQDNCLRLDTSYYYRVLASSGLEGMGSGKTQAVSLDVTVTELNSNSLQMEWAPVFGAARYQIFRSVCNGGYQFVTVVPGCQVSFDDTGLAADTMYCYQIVSDNGAVGSAQGRTAAQTIGVSVSLAGSTSLLVSWERVCGAACYSVYRSERGGTGELIALQPETAYLDRGLRQNTTYRYWVAADTGAAGEGVGTTIWEEFHIWYENLMGASNSNPISYRTDMPTIPIIDPGELPNYKFIGWFTQAVGGEQVREIPQGSSGDITLFARWEAICVHYTVLYCGNDAGGPAAEWIPFPAEAVSGNSFTLPNAIPTRRGYQFLGWNSKPDGSGDWYQPEDVIERIMADLTLYAQWTAAPPPPCRPSCGWFWYGCGFPGLTC